MSILLQHNKLDVDEFGLKETYYCQIQKTNLELRTTHAKRKCTKYRRYTSTGIRGIKAQKRWISQAGADRIAQHVEL
jgi:hypothetical protein